MSGGSDTEKTRKKELKMKKLVATVKTAEGKLTVIRGEYNTKKEFQSDLRANEMTIVNGYIFTEEEYNKLINEDEEFCTWFHNRHEKRRASARRSKDIKRRCDRIRAEEKAKAEAQAVEEVETSKGVVKVGSRITFENLTYQNDYTGTVVSINKERNSFEVECEDWADVYGDNTMTAFAMNVKKIHEPKEEYKGDIHTTMGYMVQEWISEEYVKEYKNTMKTIMESGKVPDYAIKEFESSIEHVESKVGKWNCRAVKLDEKTAINTYNNIKACDTKGNKYRLIKCMIQYDKNTNYFVIGQEPEKYKIIRE